MGQECAVIELNANGSAVTPQMAKQIRWTMHRKEIEPDQVSAHPMQKIQILNTYELCSVIVDHTEESEVPLASRNFPETFAGLPFQVSEAVPNDEIWFFTKGELVGKIRGLAKLKV
jgi:hypothetical protein